MNIFAAKSLACCLSLTSLGLAISAVSAQAEDSYFFLKPYPKEDPAELQLFNSTNKTAEQAVPVEPLQQTQESNSIDISSQPENLQPIAETPLSIPSKVAVPSTYSVDTNDNSYSKQEFTNPIRIRRGEGPLALTYSPQKIAYGSKNLELPNLKLEAPQLQDSSVPKPTLNFPVKTKTLKKKETFSSKNPVNQPVDQEPVIPETTNSNTFLRDVATSAAALQSPSKTKQNSPTVNPFEPLPLLAQEDILLGRLTRFRFNYIGVGGNIGFGGDTAIGNGTFAIISKLAFSQNISLRPSALLANGTAFLIPLTYDFLIPGSDPFEPVRFFPFVGGGAIISVEDSVSDSDDTEVGFLLTGGIDFPFAEDWVANATLNIGFLDETEAGLILGIGYRFGAF